MTTALAGAQTGQKRTGTGKRAATSTDAAARAMIALGRKVYAAHGCATCHKIGSQGGAAGPDLSATGANPKRTRQWFERQITNPKVNNPASTMPAFGHQIKGRDLTALATYLVSLKGAPGTVADGSAASRPVKVAPPDPAVVAQIERLGGRVSPIAQSDQRLEVSLRMLPTLSDAALAPLSRLKSVIRLDLGHSPVSDAGLAHIRGWTDLAALHLEQTRITDRGLAHLRGMKQLVYLNLYGTGITDAGLENLMGLSSLRRLYVWQTKVTEAGVKRLKQALPQLEVVTGWEEAPKK